MQRGQAAVVQKEHENIWKEHHHGRISALLMEAAFNNGIPIHLQRKKTTQI